MNPDNQLDHMIEAVQQGRQPTGSPDPEITDAVYVAEVFVRLNAIPVPSDLAERVLLRLGETVDRRASGGIMLPFPSKVKVRRASRLKVFVAAVACILIFVVTTAGISNVVASALPGDPLYSVKQWQQSFALSQAQDAPDRAQVAFQNIHNGLSDLRTSVAMKSSDSRNIATLANVADQTRIAQAAVGNIPPSDTREARAAELGTLINEEEHTLRTLLRQVDWAVRAAFTGQLGVLGESIPHINGIQVAGQSDHLILTITGQAFVDGTQVIIDDIIIPRVIISQTTMQIVAQFDHGLWGGGHHSIGVVNPDGTVALWANSVENNPDNGDTHQGDDPTPAATETSGGGDHPEGTPSPAGGSVGGANAVPPTPIETS